MALFILRLDRHLSLYDDRMSRTHLKVAKNVPANAVPSGYLLGFIFPIMENHKREDEEKKKRKYEICKAVCYTVCLVQPVTYLPSAPGITQLDLPASLPTSRWHCCTHLTQCTSISPFTVMTQVQTV